MKMKTLSVVYLCLWLLFSAHTASAADKRIGILVHDGVLTSDVTAPLEVFGNASRQSWFTDYEVITISVSKQPFITTEEGLKIGVDAWIGDMPEVDAFIATSAYDMKPLYDNSALISYIAAVGKKARWMASNCSGSWLLAEAGILDGKKATTWAGGEKELQSRYPKVQVQFDQNIVIDDNIVTSNGSVVSYQAALALLRLMSSPDKTQEVADALQYGRLSKKAF